MVESVHERQRHRDDVDRGDPFDGPQHRPNDGPELVEALRTVKVRSFDEKTAQAFVADRNYQALDQMVIEHLMGK